MPFPHLWTRPRGTWTPLLGAGSPRQHGEGTLLFSNWEPWPQMVQDWWERAALLESNSHWQRVWITVANTDQVSYREWMAPITVTGLPDRRSRMPCSSSHVELVAKLPRTPKDPAEGVELVHSSMSRTKTTILFLNPRFDYPLKCPHNVMSFLSILVLSM